MLLAETFVLLALEPDGRVARGASNQPAVAIGVTGALVTELALDGHLDLTDGRIQPGKTRPEHPLLAQALDNLEPHTGKKLTSRLGSIKHAGWSEVVDGMVAAGVLGRKKSPLRATRHPVADPVAHTALLQRVRAAATGDGPLEPETAMLLALAGPCQLLEVVAPERADRAQAKRRIDDAAGQVPAAPAVKAAIEAVQLAAIAAVTAATTASAGTT
jgi:hypothetical protein